MQEMDGQPRLSLKERQRQERETLILQTAEEVLLEKGYYNTSMDEIAARVGIAKGTLYHHFARKEDLVSALFEHHLQESVYSMEQLALQEGTASERLHAMLNATYQRIYGARFQLFFSLFHGLDLYQIVQDRKAPISEAMQRISNHISLLLDEGKADGSIDRSIPTPILTMLFFSMISPKAFKRLIFDEQVDPACVADHISRVFFRGIAATPSDTDVL